VVTVIAGPEANQLLTKQTDDLDNVTIWKPVLADMGAERGLGMTEGALHRRLRKLMKQSFGPDTVFQNIPTMIRLTHEAFASYKAGDVVEVTPLMQRLVATQLGFLTNDFTPDDRFEDIMTYWNALMSVYIGRSRPARILKRRAFLRSRERVKSMARDVVAARQRIPRSERDPANFIDNMLNAQEDEPSFLSDEDILFNSLTAYFAGIDTAAGTASFLVYELLKHPALFAQVQDEVAILFDGEGPTKDKIKKMSVLKASLQETLRLYPMAGLLLRSLHRDITFCGYPLSAGDTVMVATCASHFSDAFFPRPFVYEHERFLAPRHEHKQKNVYAPYGAGPHTCLGAALAEYQIMLSVSVLLHERHFQLADPGYTLQTKMDPGLLPKQLRIRFVS
jgi:cytochrome P450